MQNVYDTLKERGFIENSTHPDEVRELLGKESVTFYIGFDPTADSLTIGGLVQIMAMMHLQKAGHRPIALMGGGTGMIGDPTDRMETRKLMTPEQIEANLAGIRSQMERFLDFSSDKENKALMVNNGDWLLKMNYIETLRDVCVHFSVNRMLTADAFRTRFEREAGLTLFELNYMVLQAYDFAVLNDRYGCTMQMGGSDQWSNIIAGVDLIRRTRQKSAYGLTFALLTRSDGEKMGKSLEGAIYLDADKTSPYEFYQYLRNIPDTDVAKLMKIFTFISIDEIGNLTSSDINGAKKALAYETTALVHGETAAKEARDTSDAVFGGDASALRLKPQSGGVPLTEIDSSELSEMNLTRLLVHTSLAPSNSEARRLINQGGISLDGQRMSDPERPITAADFADGELMVKKGKKVFHRVRIKTQ